MPESLLVLSIPQLRSRDITPGGLAALDALAARGAVADLVPAVPGLAASAFATLVTGLTPSDHGVIGNTYFDRERGRVVRPPLTDADCAGTKLWERLERARPGARCLLWFGPNTAGAPVAARAGLGAHGNLETEPGTLATRLVERFGPPPVPTAATGEPPRLASTAWILDTAALALAEVAPELAIVRVPYLGQVARRYGPDGREANRAVGELDAVLGRFLATLPRNLAVLAVTESLTTPVTAPVAPNRLLRALGLLALVPAPGGGLDVDLAASSAFALADHQLCHLYLNDPGQAAALAAAFSGPDGDGIALVACGPQRRRLGLDHPRAGDLVLVAEPDRWFCPDWWLGPAEAPDPARALSGLRSAHPLVPIDPAHVRGSLGAPLPAGPEYHGVAIGSHPGLVAGPEPLAAIDLAGRIARHLRS